MKLNSSKTKVIAFTKKTDVLYYTYKLLDSSITHKDFWVKLDSKLYEGSSKSFCTFIFSRETVRAGVVIGRV